nr:immunoglobulin light chain junction region [Macaca mulatta]
CMQGTEVPWTF